MHSGSYENSGFGTYPLDLTSPGPDQKPGAARPQSTLIAKPPEKGTRDIAPDKVKEKEAPGKSKDK